MHPGESKSPVHSYFLINEIFHKSCPHIIPKPGKPGKIYWLSGPPGAGKSTTCHLLAKKNDYIYYEADATSQLKNPFIPVDVDDPAMAQMNQKSLKVFILSNVLKSQLIFCN